MKIYPVVHRHTEAQALKLTEQSFDAGADGVFLIDHLNQDPDILTSTYSYVRHAMGREAFIGVNYLSLHPAKAVEHLQRLFVGPDFPDALWADNAVRYTPSVLDVKRQHEIPHNKLRYFGGVAFKGTASYTSDPYWASLLADAAKDEVDVVTTSGPGTGLPAHVDKVSIMKAAIGNRELALASGVDSSNIDTYKPHVDAVLVASSIETHSYSGEFDLAKLRELVQAAHQ